MADSKHKSGFVSILGRPNVGKSTLLNELMGEKMSIVTDKAQTTRHRIFGIYNDEDSQIVFSDTPGILEPKYELQEKMMDTIKETFQDTDIFLYLVEANQKVEIPEWVQTFLQNTDKPVLLIVNKIDLSKNEDLDKTISDWHNLLPKAEILPISALHKANTEFIIPKLKSWISEGPAFYEKDAFTDKPERFFVNEFIREKILKNYQNEIPYSVEVVTERFKEKNDEIEIDAVIFTERESQKGILLGHKGMRLAKVRNQARKDIEKFLGKTVNLNLFIKLDKNWRRNESKLKKFGY